MKKSASTAMAAELPTEGRVGRSEPRTNHVTQLEKEKIAFEFYINF